MNSPRSQGPPVVYEGRCREPALLVLDAEGEAKRGDLPPTWQPLLDRARIGWVRMPVFLEQRGDAFAFVPQDAERVYVLANGTAAEAAVRVSQLHADVVRSVLLVDPVTDERSLGALPVPVRVVAVSEDTRNDAGAPLPLGHPIVVDAVEKALRELEPVG
ncbi:hypothetical protein [Allokutzneria albata]|uniref:Uncharacterized protein n=1 Tax=Allokutzneria albata TaxID=211114 RepID=A0A1G9VZA9_ALLAB|nr:hypothetical protein [Allokutzneria albata]SDM77632.1 hypothetical protein SAMN04489726_3318 [Allokutzneria albata]